MAELELPLVGEPTLMDETQRGKNHLLGPLLHQQMQNDRNGEERRASKK